MRGIIFVNMRPIKNAPQCMFDPDLLDIDLGTVYFDFPTNVDGRKSRLIRVSERTKRSLFGVEKYLTKLSCIIGISLPLPRNLYLKMYELFTNRASTITTNSNISKSSFKSQIWGTYHHRTCHLLSVHQYFEEESQSSSL